MFSSYQNVLQLLSLLKLHNIKRFVVSPGSRHIPIVISMEADPWFELYSIVDERSASFFALGLIQNYNQPAGIICTSGTAAANYCSAITEAYYQELPLLV
ncbi:MAG: 2-succinyl-5-enolpyruvyl-6-hydroxy-3-cyclohexene-1-carboxylic-acid synthase, partial [Muribaculaceae bacterium]|nr:2-succinyl-5-enolpyruvyl-6-hydroxy-3-cyclohexene-1-carboxylic-acid synthase [Muribaculaceae bacterium]